MGFANLRKTGIEETYIVDEMHETKKSKVICSHTIKVNRNEKGEAWLVTVEGSGPGVGKRELAIIVYLVSQGLLPKDWLSKNLGSSF